MSKSLLNKIKAFKDINEHSKQFDIEFCRDFHSSGYYFERISTGEMIAEFAFFDDAVNSYIKGEIK